MIEIIRGNKSYIIDCNTKESLQEAMIRRGIYQSADCGGRGTCGKCSVQLISGNLEITKTDQKLFGKEELEKGYRLSCTAYPKEDCKLIIVSGEEADFDVVTASEIHLAKNTNTLEESFGIAIDIGTTTIAISLIGLNSRNIVETYTSINKQRAYGADVISRIQASNDGMNIRLQDVIRGDLLEGIEKVITAAGVEKSSVLEIAIAGNTTMGHLLLGYSCETLGRYPFIPVDINTQRIEFKEIFASDYLTSTVTLLPGISTFVGGDIVAGLTVCEFDKAKKPSILIDLGTNGEMAIGTQDRILVSSTAAGPAFEGGNISHGVGSIAGAICSLSIEDGTTKYQTIAGKTPVGICGTGVIEMVAELLKAGIIDETGLLVDRYFEKGFLINIESNETESSDNESSKIENNDNVNTDTEIIYIKNAEIDTNPDVNSRQITFTQKDIRELQLAKAAIRTGIELLIQRYGASYEEIDTVYLAGGFGYKINTQKAIQIGLLPQALSGMIKAIGNSSLAGAIAYLTDTSVKQRMEHIITHAEEINLSNEDDFNDLYISYMNF